jgi:hypothetical protein
MLSKNMYFEKSLLGQARSSADQTSYKSNCGKVNMSEGNLSKTLE